MPSVPSSTTMTHQILRVSVKRLNGTSLDTCRETRPGSWLVGVLQGLGSLMPLICMCVCVLVHYICRCPSLMDGGDTGLCENGQDSEQCVEHSGTSEDTESTGAGQHKWREE